MIVSVSDLKNRITTNLDDSTLAEILQGLEIQIRKYTNNRFLKKPFVRIQADVHEGLIFSDSVHIPFQVGDTIQISIGDNATDCGIYTIKEIENNIININEKIDDLANVTISLVYYNSDVKNGVIEIINWKLKNADKVGIQSETISRHSQTFDRGSIDDEFGVPKELVGFLRPYKKASF